MQFQIQMVIGQNGERQNGERQNGEYSYWPSLVGFDI
jgi:hypothetical protein